MNNLPIFLYIFVTSDRPDLYINIIGYCIKHYKIDKIIFLGIVKDRGQKAKNEKDISVIKERVKKQLEFLQKGEYSYFDLKAKTWEKKIIPIENHDKLRHLEIFEQKIDVQCIVYDEMSNELDKILARGKCLFDVSGVLKEYLIDVYVLLLMKNAKDIYVFELRLQKRSYDERELIHNLSLDRGDYYYVPITESKYTLGTMVKTKAQDELDQTQIHSIHKLLDQLSNDFAHTMLAVYAILVLLVIIWATVFVIKGGWGQLEPWTFLVLVLFPYAINIIVMIFFKKEYSLQPSYLYNLLKNTRLKALNSKRFS